jgi:hypothetical protein
MLMEVYTHFLDMLDKTVNSKKDKVFATWYLVQWQSKAH